MPQDARIDRRTHPEIGPAGDDRRMAIADRRTENNVELVTFAIGVDWFAIPISLIQEVILPIKITPVPTAPAEIRGILNLRSQVLTVFDLRHILGYSPFGDAHIHLVVHSSEGDVCLMVDEQGDYLEVSKSFFQTVPPTIAPALAERLNGVCYLPNRKLLMMIDVEKIIEKNQNH